MSPISEDKLLESIQLLSAVDERSESMERRLGKVEDNTVSKTSATIWTILTSVIVCLTTFICSIIF